MTNRLNKSDRNRVLGGVCGGLGEYFDLDPTLVRLLFVVLAFWHGVGFVAYLVLWILMPRPTDLSEAPSGLAEGRSVALGDESGQMGERAVVPAGEAPATEVGPTTRATTRVTTDRQIVAGGLLVLLGLLMLTENLRLLWWLSLGTLWPVALIAVGVFLVSSQKQRRA